MTRPTDSEIEDEIAKCMDALESGQSRWPGMTYESGVERALMWALGHVEEPPMED